MYPDLQKELATFERRTPKSAEAHKKNLKRIPLGVASNYRAYDPWPIFVKEASGSKFNPPFFCRAERRGRNFVRPDPPPFRTLSENDLPEGVRLRFQRNKATAGNENLLKIRKRGRVELQPCAGVDGQNHIEGARIQTFRSIAWRPMQGGGPGERFCEERKLGGLFGITARAKIGESDPGMS